MHGWARVASVFVPSSAWTTEENNKMNWQQISSEWERLVPLLKVRWGKLTDAELSSPTDKRELLAGALERHYGIQRKHAELQLDRWAAALKPAESDVDDPLASNGKST